jgi:hypothetical protein
VLVWLICVLVFTVFSIFCIVFLYCFVYVYLFLFVLSVLLELLAPGEDSTAVIIIIIIGKDTISFMQGIYTYIPKTNHASKQYNVAAILSLLFMVPISLVPALALMYFYIRTFRSMCAVPNIAVFCSSLTSWFPGMVIIIIIIIKYFIRTNL